MNDPGPAPIVTVPRPRRAERHRSALLVIDLQAHLLPALWENDRVLQECLRLIQGMAALERPILATEQYRKGLGPTVREVAQSIPGFAPVEKLTFSGATPGITERLDACEARDVVLCGIETHVCVTQTALDLLDAGRRVFVAADACSSRTPANWRAGLERMQAAGAVVVSVEMMLFELLGVANTPEFKRILPLVK